jgi:hypothetical protein
VPSTSSLWTSSRLRLRVDILAMCAACKFRADSISFKENKEYEVIINCLKQDVENKK